MRRVAGVDGAPGGWVVASAAPSRLAGIDIHFVSDLPAAFEELLQNHEIVVVDMPIGLSADGDRPADRAAREFLGARRATFFPTPVHATLECATWEKANEVSHRSSGKGISKQAWNLMPKIREVNGCWRPEFADRLVEGHPESSFAAMAGAPLDTKKASLEGRNARLTLLEDHVSADVRALVDEGRHPVDTIDALALVWTARRLGDGTARWLGSADDLDPSGRPMRLAI